MTYLIQDPHGYIIPSAVSTSGYVQTFTPVHRGYMITVTVNAEPVLISSSPRIDWERLSGIDGLNPSDLQSVQTINQGVRQLMAWLDCSVPYASSDGDSQDWQDTMKRRSGNCVGRCNVLGKVLADIGISSRPVSGCLVTGDNARFHRWIEIEYPGKGSFPSDPGISMDLVFPDHIVLNLNVHAPKNVQDLKTLDIKIEKSEESKRVYYFDEWLIRDQGTGLIRRKMDSQQNSSSLYGYANLRDDKRITLSLDIGGKHFETETDEFGNFSFTGIPDGSFSLSIQSPGSSVDTLTGYLEPRSAKELVLTVPEGRSQFQ